jgi:hypothetical protein
MLKCPKYSGEANRIDAKGEINRRRECINKKKPWAE